MSPSPAYPITSTTGSTLPVVELFPFSREYTDLVWTWLNDKMNRKWFDFGAGRQDITRLQLQLMLLAPRRHARLFRVPNGEVPLGMACLNDVDDAMGWAELWTIRDVSSAAPRDITSAANIAVLANGFLDLHRYTIGCWIAENNRMSIRVANRIGLKPSGRQRARQIIDGQRRDRLFYDMTRDEFATLHPNITSEGGRSSAPRRDP